MNAMLIVSVVVLAACLIGAFVVWMVIFDRRGHRAIREQNQQQTAEGTRRRRSA